MWPVGAAAFARLHRRVGLTAWRSAVPFVCALAVAAVSLAACQRGSTVTGRVVNARTDQPVSGARVEVRFLRLDANMNWIDAGHGEIVTGPDGRFSIDNPDMRARFSIVVRKEGFYPNCDSPPLRALERRAMAMVHRVEVRLNPIVSPQNLPRGQGEIRFYPPARRMGWSFAAARIVPENMADIVGDPDELGRQVAFLRAGGRGGLVRAAGLAGKWALFNMPEAPVGQYSQRVDLRRVGSDERACYYVRTADGLHYAKIDITGGVRSRDYFGLRFYWVYQPDGSRALEIPLETAAR